jgi:hypothetical protein
LFFLFKKGTCATSGEGLYEGLDCKKKIFFQLKQKKKLNFSFQFRVVQHFEQIKIYPAHIQ